MRRKRLRAFTLIEVIAALGVIILLTLALVLTIQGQMKRVEGQNLKATVATVNSPSIFKSSATMITNS